MRTFGLVKPPDEVVAFLTNCISLNLDHARRDMPRYPICIWGSHGIGKTALVEQLVALGVVNYVTNLPLAMIEEMGDLHGLPVKGEIDGRVVTVTAPPSWVPITEEPGVLVFDDFNRADIRIIRGIMQLLQFQRTISWALPKNCIIVLTANPEDEQYAVTELDPAMLTRMFHVTMTTEFRTWLRWAATNGVDPRVMNFIARYKEQLLPTDGERTCPRAWTMFGHILQTVPELKSNIGEVRSLGNSVLDPEPVDNFIKFAMDELDMVVEPERIANEYPAVREDVFAPIKAQRLDIFNVMMERLIAHLSTLGKIQVGGTIHTNVIALLEEPTMPKEVKLLVTRELQSTTPLKNKLLSKKLAIQLGRVVGDTK